MFTLPPFQHFVQFMHIANYALRKLHDIRSIRNTIITNLTSCLNTHFLTTKLWLLHASVVSIAIKRSRALLSHTWRLPSRVESWTRRILGIVVWVISGVIWKLIKRLYILEIAPKNQYIRLISITTRIIHILHLLITHIMLHVTYRRMIRDWMFFTVI